MSVQILILSSLYDFSTDLVCQALERKGASYLRLNKESFSDYRLTLDFNEIVLEVEIAGNRYLVTQNVRSIYYRQPVFLRNTPGEAISVKDQLSRSQWMGFLRSLMVFDRACWINRPDATYSAETKAYQLKIAKDIGFQIPETIVGNDVKQFKKIGVTAVIKSLDTVLLMDGEDCLFTYSTVSNVHSISDQEVKEAPLTVQEYIYPKIDIRVTVIGDAIYAVRITSDGRGIEDDWRTTNREKLEYTDIRLPDYIEDMCRLLVYKLGLEFGAIDLILRENEYVFIEINPTGEWGWLVDDHRRIDHEIANFLMGSSDAA